MHSMIMMIELHINIDSFLYPLSQTSKDMSRSAASNMPSDAATGQKQKKGPENKGRN